MYNYIEYLPLYLREIQEFLALGEAADPAAREAYGYTVQQYLNQSVMTADERTVSRWEAILRLSGAGLSLDTRRQHVLARFCLRPPFTRKRLKEILEMLTGVPVTITEYFDLYHMRVAFFEHDFRRIDYPFLRSEVYEIKPANITLDLNIVAESESEIPAWAGIVPSIERCCEVLPQLPDWHAEPVICSGLLIAPSVERIHDLAPGLPDWHAEPAVCPGLLIAPSVERIHDLTPTQMITYDIEVI